MRAWLFAILYGLLPSLTVAATPANELEHVTTFLQATYPGKIWDGGPTELKSEALRHSYPDIRFFAVWSNEPVPPGAMPPPDHHPTWSERVQQFQATHVTAVVRMNRGGGFSLQTDFNAGLRRARTQVDRRNGCAAVLSLTSGTRAPPSVIALESLTMSPSKSGWSCRFQQDRWFMGDAEFDASGRCLNASRRSAAPLPP